ncbi:DUF6585 family protein [Streptomyces sp. NPDC006798]|uniref:DUF6585 family protein n=1 Tax=Streptomyces sp. NPDC006798 TaxID=3155462 RepID=UPI00340EC1C4
MTPNPPATLSISLPPEVAELAVRHRLGACEGAFAPKRLGILMFICHLNALFILSAFFLVPGVLYFLWLRRFPNFSRKQAAKRLYLFEAGMIVRPQSGAGVSAFRWDSLKLRQDITRLYVDGIPTPVKYVYSAYATGFGGTEITEFYEHPETWGPLMQEAVLRAQGQTVLDTVRDGGTVDFGAFDVSAAGLVRAGTGRLAWSDVEEVGIGGGQVRIVRRGTPEPWAKAPANGITNLHLFLATAEILGRRTGDHL